MKTRVIEDTQGRFYPQCKPGLFSIWKFYWSDAHLELSMLECNVLTDNVGYAASFGNEMDAWKFIDLVQTHQHKMREDYNMRHQRTHLDVKRIIKKEH